MRLHLRRPQRPRHRRPRCRRPLLRRPCGRRRNQLRRLHRRRARRERTRRRDADQCPRSRHPRRSSTPRRSGADTYIHRLRIRRRAAALDALHRDRYARTAQRIRPQQARRRAGGDAPRQRRHPAHLVAVLAVGTQLLSHHSRSGRQQRNAARRRRPDRHADIRTRSGRDDSRRGRQPPSIVWSAPFR